MSYDICLSLSDLLHSAWQSLGPSMLLQMALFHSFFFSNGMKSSNKISQDCYKFYKLWNKNLQDLILALNKSNSSKRNISNSNNKHSFKAQCEK